MAIRVDTNISLRSEYGVTFGKLLKASDKQLLIDTDTKLRPGAQVEFQLEIKTQGVTVFGIAQVTRVTAAADGPSRCLLAITQFGAKDRRVYQEWLYELAQIGGNPSHPSAVVSSILSTRLESPAAPVRSGAMVPPPTPAVLPPQAERAATWSAGTSASASRQGVGRAAVREALRARFAARGLTVPPSVKPPMAAPPSESTAHPGQPATPAARIPAPTPEAPAILPPRPPRSPDAEAEFSSKIHTVRPTRTAGGGAISITASADAEAQFSSRPQPAGSSVHAAGTAPAPAPGSPVRRVEVVVSTTGSPAVVSLKYNDPSRYVADFGDYLSKGAAFVRWAGARPDHKATVSVAITLPSGTTVRCDGEVVALLPSGFGISLRLAEADRAVLSAEARIGG